MADLPDDGRDYATVEGTGPNSTVGFTAGDACGASFGHVCRGWGLMEE